MTLAPLMECILRVRHERHKRAHKLRLIGRRQGTQIDETLRGGCTGTRIVGESKIPTCIIVVNRLRSRRAGRLRTVANLDSDKYERCNDANRSTGLTQEKDMFKRHDTSPLIYAIEASLVSAPATTVFRWS